MGAGVPARLTAAEAVDRVRALVDAAPARVVLGLAGAPGAGKSTLAARLAAAVPGTVVVPMDGFHLAHEVLVARGDVERKGAPQTFDADGYVELLRRLRAGGAGIVWAPRFRRDLEDPVAGAIGVGPDVRLVVTEGNYLLLDADPWRQVRDLLDEAWFVEPDDALRVRRLVARHEAYGRPHEVALARAVDGTDGDNARLVAASRGRAHAVVDPG